MSFDAYNGADVRHLLNSTLYYYSPKVYFANKGELQVELSTSSYQQVYPYSQNPMSNVTLRVVGMDSARIDKKFFAQCLSDIERIGESLAHNHLLTRLTFHHFLRHQSVNQFVQEHGLTIVYTIPNTVHIAKMPYSAKAKGMSFRKLLTLAILERTCTAASKVYVAEGLRPQDLLDKVNP